MKKGVLIIMVLTFSLPLMAQRQKIFYPNAFQRKDIIINTGLSFAYRKNNYTGASRTGLLPAISLSAEYGVTDFLSIGPYVGYFRRDFRFVTARHDFPFRAQYYFLGAKASLHIAPWVERKITQMIDSENLDLYLSLIGGYRYTQFSGIGFDDEMVPVIGGFAGIRYYFVEHFGLFAEFGYGPFELAIVGVALRF